MSQDQNLWYHVIGLVTRNIQVQHERPIFSVLKGLANGKLVFFFKSKSNFEVKVMVA